MIVRTHRGVALVLLAAINLFSMCQNNYCLGFVPIREVASAAAGRRSRTSFSLSAVGKTGGRVIQTDEEFQTIIGSGGAVGNSNGEGSTSSSDKPVLVFFTAAWCGPCRLSIPVVKEVSKQFASDLEIVEVCTDDLPDVASQAGVVSIPTIQMYHQAEVLDTIVGCVAKSVLASSVSKVLEDIGRSNSGKSSSKAANGKESSPPPPPPQ